jgi:hypothetical protein
MDHGRVMNLSLKVAGAVFGLLGGFLTGVWEIFLSPLYAGAVPLPVSPVLAVATNLGLVWSVKRITTSTGLSLLPGVVWFATMVLGTVENRPENVLIPSNDYMGLLAILVGAAAWALGAYRQILRRPPVRVGPAATRVAAAGPIPAGSTPAGSTPADPASAVSAGEGAEPAGASGSGAAARAASESGGRSKSPARRSGSSKSTRPGGRR